MNPKTPYQRRTVRLLNKYRDALLKFASHRAMGVSDTFCRALQSSVKKSRQKLDEHLLPHES